MEIKKLFEHTFATPIIATEFNVEEYIDFEHDQDCCEHVYIDFEHLDLYKPMIDSLKKIYKFEIWTAPED